MKSSEAEKVFDQRNGTSPIRPVGGQVDWRRTKIAPTRGGSLDEFVNLCRKGEQEPRESDEEETESDSDRILDALEAVARRSERRMRSSASSKDSLQRGVAMDSDSLLDEIALLAMNQKDDSMSGRISGLRYYLCHTVAPGRRPEAKVVMPLLNAIRANRKLPN